MYITCTCIFVYTGIFLAIFSIQDLESTETAMQAQTGLLEAAQMQVVHLESQVSELSSSIAKTEAEATQARQESDRIREKLVERERDLSDANERLAVLQTDLEAAEMKLNELNIKELNAVEAVSSVVSESLIECFLFLAVVL